MTTMTKKRVGYTFAQLDDRAKDAVREWLREGDFDWWECVYEDFERVAALFGFEILTRTLGVVTPSGVRQQSNPRIYFSSYPWSAGFDAVWRLLSAVHAGKQVREYAPEDTVLHAMADKLEAGIAEFAIVGLEPIMREGGVYGEIKGTEYGISSDSDLVWAMVAELENLNEIQQAAAGKLNDIVCETADGLAHWLAASLEAEDEYRSSDECVGETCDANEYRFDECGEPT